MSEQKKHLTVLQQGAEFAKGDQDIFTPWWRDKKRLTARLTGMIRDGDNDAVDSILTAIVARSKIDRVFRKKLSAALNDVRAGRRGNPETSRETLQAIFLHVEAERNILNRSQKEAFVSVGRCLKLSEHTIEKHYLAGKKITSTAK